MKSLTSDQRKELNKFLSILNNVINVFLSLDKRFFYNGEKFFLSIVNQIIIFNTLDKLVFKIPDIFNFSELYYYFGEDETDGFNNNNILIEIFGKRYITNTETGSILLTDYLNRFKQLLNDYLENIELTIGEKEHLNYIIRNFNRINDTLTTCQFEQYEKNNIVKTIDKIFETEK